MAAYDQEDQVRAGITNFFDGCRQSHLFCNHDLVRLGALQQAARLLSAPGPIIPIRILPQYAISLVGILMEEFCPEEVSSTT